MTEPEGVTPEQTAAWDAIVAHYDAQVEVTRAGAAPITPAQVKAVDPAIVDKDAADLKAAGEKGHGEYLRVLIGLAKTAGSMYLKSQTAGLAG